MNPSADTTQCYYFRTDVPLLTTPLYGVVKHKTDSQLTLPFAQRVQAQGTSDKSARSNECPAYVRKDVCMREIMRCTGPATTTTRGHARSCARRSRDGGGRSTAVRTHVMVKDGLVGRVGAGNDLHELLGDLGLAGAVHLALEAALEVLGVVGGGLHGAHARGELGGDRLLQAAEDLAVEVEGQDGVEQLRRLLLEDHVGRELLGLGSGDGRLLEGEVALLGRHLEDLVALHLNAAGQQRDEGAHRRGGGDHRDESRVDELNAVELAGVVGGEQLGGDLERLVGGGGLGARRRLADRRLAALEVGATLVAHQDELSRNALLVELGDTLLGLLDGSGVVRAAQTTVASDDDEANLLGIARLHQRDVERLRLEALEE